VTRTGPAKLQVDASIGLGEKLTGDTMKSVLDRADADMYREKSVAHAAGVNSSR
jgi:GGDEF domain-containing protein